MGVIQRRMYLLGRERPRCSLVVVSSDFSYLFVEVRIQLMLLCSGMVRSDGVVDTNCRTVLEGEMFPASVRDQPLGINPRCVWQDEFKLVIYLGTDPHINPLDIVWLRQDAILSADGSDLIGKSNPNVQLPNPLPELSISLIGATTIDPSISEFFTLDMGDSFFDGLRPVEFMYYVELLTTEEKHELYPDYPGNFNDGYERDDGLQDDSDLDEPRPEDDGPRREDGLREEEPRCEDDEPREGKNLKDEERTSVIDKRHIPRGPTHIRQLTRFNLRIDVEFEEELTSIQQTDPERAARVSYVRIAMLATNFIGITTNERSHFVYLQPGNFKTPITTILTNATRVIDNTEGITFTANSTFAPPDETWVGPTPTELFYQGQATLNYFWSIAIVDVADHIWPDSVTYRSGATREGDTVSFSRDVIRNDNNIFRLPYDFLPEGEYLVTVYPAAYYLNDPFRYTTEASIQLIVEAKEGVKFYGGNEKTVASDQQLELEVVDYRTDFVYTCFGDFCDPPSFEWSCTATDGSPCDDALSSSETSSPFNSVVFEQPGTYMIKVLNGNEDSDVLQLHVIDEVPLPVANLDVVTPSILDSFKTLFHKFNAEEPITLNLYLPKGKDDDQAITSVQWISREGVPLEVGSPAVISLSVTDSLIQLDPRAFATEGMGYGFTALFTTDGSQATGSVSIEIIFNEKPYGGFVEIVSRTPLGEGGFSVVEVRCNSVVDESLDTPLVYTFSYRPSSCAESSKVDGKCPRHRFTAERDVNFASIILPDGTHELSCAATDKHGATADFAPVLETSSFTCDQMTDESVANVERLTNYFFHLRDVENARNMLDVIGVVLVSCPDLTDNVRDILSTILTRNRDAVDEWTENTPLTAHQKSLTTFYDLVSSSAKFGGSRKRSTTADSISILSGIADQFGAIANLETTEIIAVTLNSLINNGDGVSGDAADQVESLISTISSSLLRPFECNTRSRELSMSDLKVIAAREDVSGQRLDLGNGVLFVLPENLHRFDASQGGCLGYYSAVYQSSPFQIESDLPFASEFTALSITDSAGEELVVSNAGSIHIQMPLTRKALQAYEELPIGPVPRDFIICGFWDVQVDAFSSSGCGFVGISTFNGVSSAVCICTHLTSFASLFNGGGDDNAGGGTSALDDLKDQFNSLALEDIDFVADVNRELLADAFGSDNLERNSEGDYALKSDAELDSE